MALFVSYLPLYGLGSNLDDNLIGQHTSRMEASTPPLTSLAGYLSESCQLIVFASVISYPLLCISNLQRFRSFAGTSSSRPWRPRILMNTTT